jgi:serine/threonine protein kinase
MKRDRRSLPDLHRTPTRVEVESSETGSISVSRSVLDFPALERGRLLGKYKILRQIGRGGMAHVYAAWDTSLHRRVALKVLSRQSDPDILSRFQREAQVLASLSHPNIVAIHDFLDAGHYCVTVMEHVEGRTLREHLQYGALRLKEALLYGSQIAEGLASAHDRKIIHRDLKPENVLVSSSGQAKLADFGLSKRLFPPGDRNDTDAGMILGTVAYMSPEQARGEPLDFRSDIFAFGIVLFEMVTGIHPFAGETATQTMASILRNPPLLTFCQGPEYDAVLDIAHQCLHKRRENRYGSAHVLAQVLMDLRR